MHVALALPGNEGFAAKLADAAGAWLGHLEARQFPDGESYVRILTDVRDRDVDLVCTLSRPDEQLLPMLFAAEAARAHGAHRVSLIAPYLAYMRQDRRFKAGEALTSKTFAGLVSSAFDGLVTVDPHLHRYQSLSALYALPTTTLHAAPLLADWVATNVPDPLLLGPDEESEQWVGAIAGRIGAAHAVMRKIRLGDRNVELQLPNLDQWRDRQPVLIDDIAASGETLIEAASKLHAMGLPKPVCVVVHPVFAGDSFVRLQAVSKRVVSSDTIRHPSNAISVVPIVAPSLKGGRILDTQEIRRRRPPEPSEAAPA